MDVRVALIAAETEISEYVCDYPRDVIPPDLYRAVGLLAAHYMQIGAASEHLPEHVKKIIAPWAPGLT